MISQGPFDLTLGTLLELPDPGANSNNPATAVQIQNASPFILSINSGATVLTIQPFTAQTVAAAGSQPLTVDPIAAGGNAQSLATASLVIVWLLAGESSPMVDGPLTAAAIALSIGQAGLAGAVVIGYTHTLAPGGQVNPALVGPGNFRLWNWGLAPILAGTMPTTGFGAIQFGPIGTLVTDIVTVQQLASARLAGIVFSETDLTLTNGTDQEVDVFIDYSAA